jgi:predicted alpha/beta hydrolase family esterase
MTRPSPPSLSTTIVIVPGLRDAVPAHWQTHLQNQCPNAVTVPPLSSQPLSCLARVQALNAVIERIQGPIVLVAHSAGVMITVHWARHHTRAIQGALLATPADLESPLPAGYPNMDALREGGWLPLPRAPLPFPSIVAASQNDPLATQARIADMARHWSSRLVDVGAVGHLNPASGYGPWPAAHELIAHWL